MKYWGRVALNGIVATSALMFVVIVFGASRDRRISFSWHGAASELAWRDGRLWFDTKPQLKKETEQAAAAAKQMATDSAAREAHWRQIMKAEPWGTPAYRQALDQLNHLRESEADDRSKQQLALAAAATKRVEHSISLGLLLGALACAPVIWTLITIPRRLRLPRAEVRRPRRLNLLATAAALSAIVCMAILALWMRSLVVGDELVYASRSPARQALTVIQLRTVKDTVHLYRWERIYASRRGYDFEDPASDLSVVTPSGELTYGGLTHITRPPIGLWGFHFEHIPLVPWSPGDPTKQSSLLVTIPLWVFMLLCMIFPLIWVRRRLCIVRNTGRALCVSCGYDLRETPERCPECGAIPKG